MNETKESQKLKAVFLRLARGFTTKHNMLSCESNHQGDFVTLSPRAHRDDAPKLVGSGASTFRAMINVLTVVANNLGVKFYLSRIKDVAGTEPDANQPPFYTDENWPKDAIMTTFNETCAELFREPYTAEWNHQSGGKSEIELELSPSERLCVADAQLEDGLSILFNAIGKSNGRVLRVTLKRKGSNIESLIRPERADHVRC